MGVLEGPQASRPDGPDLGFGNQHLEKSIFKLTIEIRVSSSFFYNWERQADWRGVKILC